MAGDMPAGLAEEKTLGRGFVTLTGTFHIVNYAIPHAFLRKSVIGL